MDTGTNRQHYTDKKRHTYTGSHAHIGTAPQRYITCIYPIIQAHMDIYRYRYRYTETQLHIYVAMYKENDGKEPLTQVVHQGNSLE